MSMINLRLAVAPHNHIRFCDSILGLAGKIRELLTTPKTIDELLSLLSYRKNDWPGQVDIEKLILAVALLYAIGTVTFTDDKRIVTTS